ncbi:MAG: ribosome small subunit-dependent GTPase A [Ruminococcaceae bacterium]|nr:ribosome small subunit-dependent GTPase A [Oscillospiraceae bacterium]
MTEKQLNGIIIKGIGGFYYIEANGDIYECKARGAFRKKKISPLAGDNVIITVRENGENTIDDILERKNFLIRPPVANVDTLVIVSSVKEPVPSTLVIDRLTAIAVSKNIKPCIVFSKSDLGDTKELEEIYKKANIDVCSVCCKTGEGVEKVKEMIKGGITVFTGNTGVGKSSLLNCIDSRFSIETGEVSSKLGRGRHTTRDVTLHKVNDFYVADTPGFSSLDIESGELIMKDDLPYCFPEFSEYLGKCRFSSCTHTVDKGCKILDALEKGDIHESRHLSYVTMFNEVKNIKEWQL